MNAIPPGAQSADRVATPVSQVQLWNPNAAASWSLLFTPAFGSYLHEQNALALGRTDEAQANRRWFYVSLAYLFLCLASIFFPSIPDSVFRGAGIGLLLGWYFTLAKKQAQYVKENLQQGYVRKPWSRPLLVASGCLVGFLVVAVVIGFIAAPLVP